MVFLTAPRQLGKTTLSRWLLAQSGGQYLNCDVADDLRLIVQQRWSARAPLLVLDELQKCQTGKPGSKACTTANLPRSSCWSPAARG